MRINSQAGWAPPAKRVRHAALRRSPSRPLPQLTAFRTCRRAISPIWRTPRLVGLRALRKVRPSHLSAFRPPSSEVCNANTPASTDLSLPHPTRVAAVLISHAAAWTRRPTEGFPQAAEKGGACGRGGRRARRRSSAVPVVARAVSFPGSQRYQRGSSRLRSFAFG